MNDPRDLLAAFHARERVKHDSVLLPTKGPITEDQHTDVRAAFVAFTERHAISQESAARQMRGVSASTISQWLSRSYKGDNDSKTKQINRWIERQSAILESRTEYPFIRTRVVEDMTATIAHACNFGLMAAIVAPAGAGKTRLLKHVAEERDGLYVYADGDMTPSGLQHAIAAAGKLPINATGGVSRIRDDLVKRLEGTNRPIIIDEAHLLAPKLFAGLRSIHDRTGCPVIFAGAMEILQRVDDRSTGEGQLYSRTVQLNILETYASVEGGGGGSFRDGDHLGEPLFTFDEIQAFTSSSGMRLSPPAMEMLWAIASLPSYGCLRTVRTMLEAARVSFGPQKALTLGDLETIGETLFGLRSSRLVETAQRQRKTYLEAAVA